MKNFEALSIEEIKSINGGFQEQGPTIIRNIFPIIEIIPFGDPQDWDPYFHNLPLG